MMLYKKGFTLIELLLVISIVGLLSSVVLGSLNSAREKGRVAAGQQFSQGLKNALGSNLLAEWSFNGNALDTSNNGHNGTINGAVYVTGVFGEALSFDGTNDDVDCVVGSSIQPSKVTIEAWVNIPGGTTGNRTVVETGVGGILLQANSTDVHWWFNTAETSHIYTVSLSGWKHVAVSHDYTSDETKLYIDGVEVLIITENISLPIGNRLTIGSYSNDRYFNGVIDDVRIYSTTLSLTEIQKHYADGLKDRTKIAIR